MKKGSKLFFEISNEAEDLPRPKRIIGRSPKMLLLRNEVLFFRYYYYSKILRYSYDVALHALVSDFFLAEETIIRLLSDKSGEVREKANLKLTRGQLKEKFPQFNWTHKAAVIAPATKKRFTLS